MTRRGYIVFVALLTGCGRVAFDDTVVDAQFVDAQIVDAVACVAPYLALGASCYRFVLDGSTTENWLDVEATCEADGPGAHLAVIDDELELALLIEQLRLTSTVDAAIGFSDRATEGTYRTVTGGAAFLSWAPGNPDGTNDCGELATSPTDTGMKDVACASNFNDYICENDGVAADPTAFRGYFAEATPFGVAGSNSALETGRPRSTSVSTVPAPFR